ncbi:hypothetical protein [Microbacterium sp. NPDC089696]|uniref:hypothetical protein n=1 Tax=Microbacterium sp. NPDC089696 TaxID=3364199 RepID=UPI0037F88664
MTVGSGFLVAPGTERFGARAGQFLTFFTVFGVGMFLASPVILYVLGLPMLAVFGGAGPVLYFVVLPVAALSLSTPTVVLPLIIGHIGGARRSTASCSGATRWPSAR